MASEAEIPETVCEKIEAEDRKLVNKTTNVAFNKISKEELNDAEDTSHEIVKVNFEVENVNTKEGSARPVEGESFLNLPTIAKVSVEGNNSLPDSHKVVERANQKKNPCKIQSLEEERLDNKPPEGLAIKETLSEEIQWNAEELSIGLDKVEDRGAVPVESTVDSANATSALEVEDSSHTPDTEDMKIDTEKLKDTRNVTENECGLKDQKNSESSFLRDAEDIVIQEGNKTVTTSEVSEIVMENIPNQSTAEEENQYIGMEEVGEHSIKTAVEKTEENSLKQVVKSHIKHEEYLQKESGKMYLTEAPMQVANHEGIGTGDLNKAAIGEDERSSENCVLYEKPVESMCVAPEEIKVSVSCQNAEATSTNPEQSLYINPQEIHNDKTKMEIDTADMKDVPTNDLNEAAGSSIPCCGFNDLNDICPPEEEKESDSPSIDVQNNLLNNSNRCRKGRDQIANLKEQNDSEAFHEVKEQRKEKESQVSDDQNMTSEPDDIEPQEINLEHDKTIQSEATADEMIKICQEKTELEVIHSNEKMKKIILSDGNMNQHVSVASVLGNKVKESFEGAEIITDIPSQKVEDSYQEHDGCKDNPVLVIKTNSGVKDNFTVLSAEKTETGVSSEVENEIKEPDTKILERKLQSQDIAEESSQEDEGTKGYMATGDKAELGAQEVHNIVLPASATGENKSDQVLKQDERNVIVSEQEKEGTGENFDSTYISEDSQVKTLEFEKSNIWSSIQSEKADISEGSTEDIVDATEFPETVGKEDPNVKEVELQDKLQTVENDTSSDNTGEATLGPNKKEAESIDIKSEHESISDLGKNRDVDVLMTRENKGNEAIIEEITKYEVQDETQDALSSDEIMRSTESSIIVQESLSTVETIENIDMEKDVLGQEDTARSSDDSANGDLETHKPPVESKTKYENRMEVLDVNSTNSQPEKDLKSVELCQENLSTSETVAEQGCDRDNPENTIIVALDVDIKTTEERNESTAEILISKHSVCDKEDKNCEGGNKADGKQQIDLLQVLPEVEKAHKSENANGQEGRVVEQDSEISERDASCETKSQLGADDPIDGEANYNPIMTEVSFPEKILQVQQEDKDTGNRGKVEEQFKDGLKDLQMIAVVHEESSLFPRSLENIDEKSSEKRKEKMTQDIIEDLKREEEESSVSKVSEDEKLADISSLASEATENNDYKIVCERIRSHDKPDTKDIEVPEKFITCSTTVLEETTELEAEKASGAVSEVNCEGEKRTTDNDKEGTDISSYVALDEISLSDTLQEVRKETLQEDEDKETKNQNNSLHTSAQTNYSLTETPNEDAPLCVASADGSNDTQVMQKAEVASLPAFDRTMVEETDYESGFAENLTGNKNIQHQQHEDNTKTFLADTENIKPAVPEQEEAKCREEKTTVGETMETTEETTSIEVAKIAVLEFSQIYPQETSLVEDHSTKEKEQTCDVEELHAENSDHIKGGTKMQAKDGEEKAAVDIAIQEEKNLILSSTMNLDETRSDDRKVKETVDIAKDLYQEQEESSMRKVLESEQLANTTILASKVTEERSDYEIIAAPNRFHDNTETEDMKVLGDSITCAEKDNQVQVDPEENTEPQVPCEENAISMQQDSVIVLKEKEQQPENAYEAAPVAERVNHEGEEITTENCKEITSSSRFMASDGTSLSNHPQESTIETLEEGKHEETEIQHDRLYLLARTDDSDDKEVVEVSSLPAVDENTVEEVNIKETLHDDNFAKEREMTINREELQAEKTESVEAERPKAQEEEEEEVGKQEKTLFDVATHQEKGVDQVLDSSTIQVDQVESRVSQVPSQELAEVMQQKPITVLEETDKNQPGNDSEVVWEANRTNCEDIPTSSSFVALDEISNPHQNPRTETRLEGKEGETEKQQESLHILAHIDNSPMEIMQKDGSLPVASADGSNDTEIIQKLEVTSLPATGKNVEEQANCKKTSDAEDEDNSTNEKELAINGEELHAEKIDLIKDRPKMQEDEEASNQKILAEDRDGEATKSVSTDPEDNLSEAYEKENKFNDKAYKTQNTVMKGETSSEEICVNDALLKAIETTLHDEILEIPYSTSDALESQGVESARVVETTATVSEYQTVKAQHEENGNPFARKPDSSDVEIICEENKLEDQSTDKDVEELKSSEFPAVDNREASEQEIDEDNRKVFETKCERAETSTEDNMTNNQVKQEQEDKPSEFLCKPENSAKGLESGTVIQSYEVITKGEQMKTEGEKLEVAKTGTGAGEILDKEICRAKESMKIGTLTEKLQDEHEDVTDDQLGSPTEERIVKKCHEDEEKREDLHVKTEESIKSSNENQEVSKKFEETIMENISKHIVFDDNAAEEQNENLTSNVCGTLQVKDDEEGGMGLSTNLNNQEKIHEMGDVYKTETEFPGKEVSRLAVAFLELEEDRTGVNAGTELQNEKINISHTIDSAEPEPEPLERVCENIISELKPTNLIIEPIKICEGGKEVVTREPEDLERESEKLLISQSLRVEKNEDREDKNQHEIKTDEELKDEVCISEKVQEKDKDEELLSAKKQQVKVDEVDASGRETEAYDQLEKPDSQEPEDLERKNEKLLISESLRDGKSEDKNQHEIKTDKELKDEVCMSEKVQEKDKEGEMLSEEKQQVKVDEADASSRETEVYDQLEKPVSREPEDLERESEKLLISQSLRDRKSEDKEDKNQHEIKTDKELKDEVCISEKVQENDKDEEMLSAQKQQVKVDEADASSKETEVYDPPEKPDSREPEDLERESRKLLISESLRDGKNEDKKDKNQHEIKTDKELKDEVYISEKVQEKDKEEVMLSAEKQEVKVGEADASSRETEVYDQLEKPDFSSQGKDTSEILHSLGPLGMGKGSEGLTHERTEEKIFTDTTECVISERKYPDENGEGKKPKVGLDFHGMEQDFEAVTDGAEIQDPKDETTSSFVQEAKGVQCGEEEKTSYDCQGMIETTTFSKSKIMQSSMAGKSEAGEDKETQDQLAKLHDLPPVPHIRDSEWGILEEDGGIDLQKAENINEDMQELDERSIAQPNKENQDEINSKISTKYKIACGGKEVEITEEDTVLGAGHMETEKQELEKSFVAISEAKGPICDGHQAKIVDCEVTENSSYAASDEVSQSNILQGSAGEALHGTKDQIALIQQNELPILAETEYSGMERTEIDVKSHVERVHGNDSEKVAQKLEAAQISVSDKQTVTDDHANNIDASDSTVENKKIEKLQGEIAQEEGTTQETIESNKNSVSTETAKASLSYLLQGSLKESSEKADHCTEEQESRIRKDELHAEGTEHAECEEEIFDEEKVESRDHKIGSDVPVVVNTAAADTKVSHKKSHKILSGVGSKVKHSIAKVKKAITGKSSHPKPTSPKEIEKC